MFCKAEKCNLKFSFFGSNERKVKGREAGGSEYFLLFHCFLIILISRKEWTGTPRPYIVCTLLSALRTLYQILKKWVGSWQDLKFLRRVLRKRELIFFKEIAIILHKNKLKSEYLMTKRLIKMFWCFSRS